MDCIKTKSLITEYLYDEIDKDLALLIEEHIANCDECRKIFNSNKRALNAYRSIKKTTPAKSFVKSALSTSRDARQNAFKAGKASSITKLEPYLKYIRHPLFAAASVAVVIGIVVINSWETDEEYLKKNQLPVTITSNEIPLLGEEKAKLPPITDTAKKAKKTISAEVSQLVTKAKKKISKLESTDSLSIPKEETMVTTASTQEKVLPKIRRREQLQNVDSIDIERKEIPSKPTLKSQMALRAKAITTNKRLLARTTKQKEIKNKDNKISANKTTDSLENNDKGLELHIVNNLKNKDKPQKDKVETTKFADDTIENVNGPEISGFEEEEADVVEDIPTEPEDILKKSFELFQKQRYSDALYYLDEIPNNVGKNELTIAVIELRILCHNILGNKEEVEQGLDILTHLNPAFGSRLARKIKNSRINIDGKEEIKPIIPISKLLQTKK